MYHQPIVRLNGSPRMMEQKFNLRRNRSSENLRSLPPRPQLRRIPSGPEAHDVRRRHESPEARGHLHPRHHQPRQAPGRHQPGMAHDMHINVFLPRNGDQHLKPVIEARKRNQRPNLPVNGRAYINVKPSGYGNYNGYNFAELNRRYRMPGIDEAYGLGGVAQHSHDQFDLQFIILRHSDRIDRVEGSKWFDKFFDEAGKMKPQQQAKNSLANRLPNRKPPYMYIVDPPLSAEGQNKAVSLGTQLAKRMRVDYCYSSPASRCVLTADAVLRGMARNDVRIRLETDLFEPMIWNLPLRDLKIPDPFLSPNEWAQTGIKTTLNSETRKGLPLSENSLSSYLDRSKQCFDQIVRQCDQRRLNQRSMGQPAAPITVLIVGHAATGIVLSAIASNKRTNEATLNEESKLVPYLKHTTLRRHPTKRNWSLSLHH